MTAPPGSSKAVLLAFAGIYIIWGTTFIGIALAIRTMPPFFSGAIRFFIASALMYVWLRACASRIRSRASISAAACCAASCSAASAMAL